MSVAVAGSRSVGWARRRCALPGIASAAALLLAWGSGAAGAAATEPPTTQPPAGVAEASDEWQQVIEEAQSEGSVVVMASQDEAVVSPVLDAFSEAYGIDVELIRLTASQAIPRLNAELDAGVLSVDVAWNTDTSWQSEVSSAGYLQEINGAATEGWDASLYANGIAKVKIDPLVLIYNTDLVETTPTDWDSLLDEEYRGRIGIREPASTSVFAYYDFLETTMGPEYLPALAALEPRIYTADLQSAVISGEVAWAPYAAASAAERDMTEDGAPIDWIVPESGTIAFEVNAMAFSEAPHPNAARLLVDFMMTSEGQTAINGNGGGVSPNGTAEGALDVDLELIHSYDPTVYDEEKTAEIRDRFVDLFQ